jgi:hypothetical protein
VVADIVGPAGNQSGKSPPIIREQGARGFLKPGRLPAMVDMK